MSDAAAFPYETTSLCKTCKASLPARVVERPGAETGEVWLEKTCKMHGFQEVRLSTDARWYAETRAVEHAYAAPPLFPKEVARGCPFDCGMCNEHVARTRLPVVTITSACNLDCPICYVHNKNEGAYQMPLDDFRRTLAALRREQGELDIVNLTGGEPTLHPRLLEMLAIAKDEGVHRVTVCSNGIRLVKDRAFSEALATLGARIALSFDTFDERADVAMQGAKMLDIKLAAVELCDELGLDVTLIPVVTRGYNDHELGKLIDYSMQHTSIRHLELHTMTYTGQSGGSFDRAGRISMVEVLDAIRAQTNGLLAREDFVTSPCAHPLCYQVAYLLVDREGASAEPPIPYTRFLSRETLRASLGERLYLEPNARLESAMKTAAMELFAKDDAESERALRLLKAQTAALFPTDREVSREEVLRAAERGTKAIYVHSHMDEETFDTERLAACCDANCYADGTQIPVCAYNVLYREKESSFMLQPRAWNDRSGGRLNVAAAAKTARRLPLATTR
jgi:uncharacterized radical SAM superfamily Fe-S cluster-containing enzyme